MCDSHKKSKRSFVEAWLKDDQYKAWIQKVPSNDSLFHCTICNKDFSCNTRISRHADSSCHKNNIKESFNNNDVNIKPNISDTYKFQKQWLEMKQFQPWLCEVSHNNKLFFCSFCEKSVSARLSSIYEHAESAAHVTKEKNVEKKQIDEDVTDETLSFEERKKAAEIKFAAFIAEHNISLQTAPEILKFFQQIGKDVNVLQSMTMSRIKCQRIISNVLCPIETNRVVDIIQNTKFTIFIDETSDISNQKWMTFLVRYVNPETLDISSQLVKLIDIDAKDCSAEKLFDAFKCEMWKLKIPFSNIVALSCDNASVMTGKYSSFKTKLEKFCKNLLTFPCPCHASALIANAACSKIPDYCEEFVKKVASFINSSPKRSAIFQEFSECFKETNHKILKLCDTRWLSRHLCIERILNSWDTINNFLTEIVVSDKTQSGENLLSVMHKPDVKAYLLFLKHILHFFNSFNAFFQALETSIQKLQPKSLELLNIICKHFLNPELLRNINNTFDFSNKANQKSLSEVNLGSECEKYLEALIKQGHADVVANVRENCLQFYVTAAKDICTKLPINDIFLSKLKVFEFNMALNNSNREASFNDVFFVAQTFGGFDDNSLRKEWFALHQSLTEAEKDYLSTLNFDDMWKQIFQRTHKYPNFKSLVNAVRSLPNSNADSERIFSLLPDIKTKKRNKLSSVTVNATCVIKSALKARRETAVDININEKHLSLMSANNLYSACPKKQKNHLRLYAADDTEDAGPSTSNMCNNNV